MNRTILRIAGLLLVILALAITAHYLGGLDYRRILAHIDYLRKIRGLQSSLFRSCSSLASRALSDSLVYDS